MKLGTSMKVIPAAVLALFSGYASASGFQLIEQNASGLGNAYAGSAAVAENASTIFYNPAGMTQLQAHEVSAGVNAVTPSFKFSNSSNSPTLGALQNAGSGGDGGGTNFLPNAYLSWALTKDLYLGLGIGAPFGLKTEYSNPWQGAAQSLKFEIKTLNINPSVAYKVNDAVSLGFGLNWQKLDAEYVRVISVANAGLGTIPLASSQIKLNLNDSAWGWNAGALFTLSPSTKVGVSYRSAIKFSTTGNLSGSGPNVTGGPLTGSTINSLTSSGASAEIKLPDTFILSVTQKLSDKWDMLGDVSWTGWSSIPKVDIIRTSTVATVALPNTTSGSTAQSLNTDFRDTWRVALGANYQLNDAWKLKFGIAYDQTPVKGADTRLVSLPDNNRTWLSLGAQWKLSPATRVDFGGSYLYVKDASINNDQSAAGRGLINGTFKDSAWILGAQYSQAF